jgi:hypothetical protein
MTDFNKGCMLCRRGYPHAHSVLIPIRDERTNEMKYLSVKEGSSLHKQFLEWQKWSKTPLATG